MAHWQKWKRVKWGLGGLLFCLSVLMICSVTDASSDEKVKVGVIGPMMFIHGQDSWNGALIAAEEINEAGGVRVGNKRYEIELVKADSNEWRSIADGASAMERLITVSKVKMVTGGYRSEAVLNMQEVAADNKTIYFSVGAGAPQIAERVGKNYDKYKYWFREGQPNTIVGGISGFAVLGVVANKVINELGVKSPKAALLFERVMWADASVQKAQDLLPKMGIETVGIWRPSFSATDLRAELDAITATGAHIIFEGVSGPVGVVLGRQWGELKIPAALVGYNIEGLKGKYWEATGGLCNYEAIAEYVARVGVTERAISFFDKFMKKFGTYPTNSALSYNAIWIWKEAVERAGTLDGDTLVAEIEKTDFPGANGRIRYTLRDDKWPHDIRWGPKDLTLFGAQWKDGKKLVIWPDGQPALGDEGWKGVRFSGTVDYELPPWVKNYWKGKK